MTAEIALLNKVAVALAADSAATLSAGNRNEKVFNTEDKLFELSNSQPIGVMIYNSTSFLETPIQIIIRDYRSLSRTFETVDDAAKDFRKYLDSFGRKLPTGVKTRSFERLTAEPMQFVSELFSKKLAEIPSEDRPTVNFNSVYESCLDDYLEVINKSGHCEFIKPRNANATIKMVQETLSGSIEEAEGEDEKRKKRKINSSIERFLRSDIASRSSTGFVIAGFGRKELFPSLRSFIVDGMIGGTLRYMGEQQEDITFEGKRARILPYAQQEMVDRFVSGIDERSQDHVQDYCRKLLIRYNADLINALSITDDDRMHLEAGLERAEGIFIQTLKDEGFGAFKEKATKDMEGMVEFMPKPDMAQMAEALVELTSVKRRVSKGFDTVGGPIDVAVISKSEGFVWIKRKHYFTAEKNARFFAKLSGKVEERRKEEKDGVGRKTAASRPGTRAAGGREQGSRDSQKSPSRSDEPGTESAP